MKVLVKGLVKVGRSEVLKPGLMDLDEKLANDLVKRGLAELMEAPKVEEPKSKKPKKDD